MTETGRGQTILWSIADPGAAKLCTVQTEVNDESDVDLYTVALNTLQVKRMCLKYSQPVCCLRGKA